MGEEVRARVGCQQTHRTSRKAEPPAEPGAAQRFVTGAGSGSRPPPPSPSRHAPVQTAKGIVSAQGAEFGKAREAFNEGRYS